MWSRLIDLDDWHECAKGGQRNIYESRACPGVLIKTVKAASRGKDGARVTRSTWKFMRKYRRFGAYMSFKREADEYIEQARKQQPGQKLYLPIAAVHGFCQTSDGLGLIVERVSDASGALAPTLGQLLKEHRFSEKHFKMVREYFARCARLHIVMMDLNLDNLVVANRYGYEEIVCIDGTGDKSAIRIYSASRFMNALNLRRLERKLLRKIHKRLNVPQAFANESGRERLSLQNHQGIRSEE